MRRVLLAAALPLCFAVSAHAADTRMSKTDGNKLLSICTAKAPNLAQGCEAYIDGVADTIGVFQHEAAAPDAAKVAERTCVPGAATGAQLRDVVVNFLKEHAADRNRFAALIVSHALHESYPCH